MKILIFIHGGESFIDEKDYQKFLHETYSNWQSEPWEEKEKIDYRVRIARNFISQWWQVFYPSMPNKQNARYADWKIVFDGILSRFDPADEITLVGNSLGGCFLLKYFSEVSVIPGLIRDPAKKGDSIDITGFLPSQEWQETLRIHQIHLMAACMSAWDFTPPESYEFLQKLWNRVHIWHAEDDRVVPISVGKNLAKTLPDAHTHFFPSEKEYW
jgi:hypothetical protein